MKIKTLNKIKNLAKKQVGKSKAPKIVIQMNIEYKMWEITEQLKGNKYPYVF